MTEEVGTPHLDGAERSEERARLERTVAEIERRASGRYSPNPRIAAARRRRTAAPAAG